MIEEDINISSLLRVNFANVTASKDDFIEVIPQISQVKQPILHKFITMKTDQLIQK